MRAPPWCAASPSAAAASSPPATRRRRAPRDARIDLRGRTVVPGLIEPHVHIVSLANRPGYHTPLENTTSIREIQETLAARRKSVPEGQWITSMGGWHTNQWAEHRHPTLKELDEAVPDRPVLLYERFTGPCVDQHAGQAVLRRRRRRRLAAPELPEDQRVRGRRHRRRGRQGRPVGQRALPPAPDADVRGQAAQHDGRDGLLRRRGPDRAPGPGALPHAGPAGPECRSCRTSTTTGCTTRGSRCTARAARWSGCR